jgi:glucokinase
MITLNRITMEQNYAIGIDVGGSSLKCGVVNQVGEIVFSTLISLSNAKTESAVIALIAKAIEICQEQAYLPITGVGIGFPGVIENNVIIGGADNLPGFEQLALGKILEELIPFPVIIDNDANLMGLGELNFGAAKACSDAVFLTVGTGIGGAIMINNQLYGGYKNRGAELGHIIIEHKGLPCACGGVGCLETYASVTSLVNYYCRLKNEIITTVDGRHIVEQYLAKEEIAVKAMERHFDYLAAGIASFVNVFSPQMVIIGGGISEAGMFYIDELKKRTQQLVIPVTYGNTEIKAANLGNKAGLLGCAALVFQKFKPVSQSKEQTN